MPFEKGHKFSTGRKSGGKNNPILIKYSPHKWDHSFKNSSYKQDEVEHRLNNNLPIDDLTDTLITKYNKGEPRKSRK